MSSVLQRLLHNLNLHSLLPSHWDSMAVGLAQAGACLCFPLRWLSIYNKEWDITVIQPISSTSTSKLFRKALVDIWINLYLIKFQFLAILCVFLSSFHLKNSSSQVYNPVHINLIRNHKASGVFASSLEALVLLIGATGHHMAWQCQASLPCHCYIATHSAYVTSAATWW